MSTVQFHKWKTYQSAISWQTKVLCEYDFKISLVLFLCSIIIDILYTLDSASLLVKLKPRIDSSGYPHLNRWRPCWSFPLTNKRLKTAITFILWIVLKCIWNRVNLFKFLVSKKIENIRIFSFHGNDLSLQSRLQFLNCRTIRCII
jgi:hypothetical protein